MMELLFNFKRKSFDAGHVIACVSISLCVLAGLMDLCLGREIVCKGIMTLAMSVHVFILLLSSLCEKRLSIYCSGVLLAMQVCICVESIVYVSGSYVLMWTRCFGMIMLLDIFFALAIFVRGIWNRVANIRQLTNEGTVWGNMQLCVESLYTVAYISVAFVAVIGWLAGGEAGRIIMLSAFLLLLCQLAALVVRMHGDTLLVFRKKHEGAVLESLKISQLEIASGPKPEAYRDLYDRILEYFEREKPFLNNKVTVSDVAKVVFSNKSYISRVISIFTGRNFCQFVNYYRITYAIGAFRSNPSLKITQLAAMSGFNSVVSFNTAFRLFMDENPSDWCRKEKRKLLKKKK